MASLSTPILSFDTHISNTAARAFMRANVFHSFISRDAATLWPAFVYDFMFDRCWSTLHVFGRHIVWVRLTASNLHNANSLKGYQDTIRSIAKSINVSPCGQS